MSETATQTIREAYQARVQASYDELHDERVTAVNAQASAIASGVDFRIEDFMFVATNGELDRNANLVRRLTFLNHMSRKPVGLVEGTTVLGVGIASDKPLEMAVNHHLSVPHLWRVAAQVSFREVVNINGVKEHKHHLLFDSITNPAYGIDTTPPLECPEIIMHQDDLIRHVGSESMEHGEAVRFLNQYQECMRILLEATAGSS